jgi:hypothetical protein
MNIRSSLIASTATTAALIALLGGQLPQAELVANNSTFTTFSDLDNDGLDDALEARWGLSDVAIDSDGDQLTDLDEILLGTDPLEFDDLVRLDPPEPTMKIDSYVCDNDLVIQIMTLQKFGTNNIRFYWADATSFQEVPRTTLRGLTAERHNYTSIIPGYSTQVIKIVLPRLRIEALGAVAIGIEGFTDGVAVGDQIRFTYLGNKLLEWRTTGAFSRYNAQNGGGGGGLFPVDPLGGMPGEATSGEVCVQTLQEVASLGNGQKLYQVSDSYCDYLPTAKCFVGCSASIGDTLVGIDIVGLLAN